MTYPAYPAYKDSGVTWLGSVPQHWNLLRLKNTVTCCENGLWGEEPTDDGNDIVCVRVADFDRPNAKVKVSNLTLRSIPSEQFQKRRLKRGDLLLEKSGGGENQPVGFVVLFEHDFDAVCSNFVARMTPSERALSTYLNYLHSALYRIRVNVGHIKQNTGIQNLDSNSYLSERIALPPLPEQAAIAAFLDRETAKIAALIAKQERMIALLGEKWQALIAHAVTKGLRADAPMKDSGVAWLGEIPAHWEVKKLGFIATEIQTGPFGSQLHAEDYVEGGTPVINPGNIRNGAIVPDPACAIDDQLRDSLQRHILQEGNIVFGRRGEMGRCALVTKIEAGWLCGTGCLNVGIDHRLADPAFIAIGPLC